MPNKPTTFFDELVLAAQGCLALLTGNRQAASYFDFRQIGLVGSFIALLIGLAVQIFVPQLVGSSGAQGSVSGALILTGIVLLLQFGAAYLVLRLLGRGDGLVPFIVVQNWATLFQSIIAVAIIATFGQPIAFDAGGEMAQLTSGSIPFIALGIAALVASINVARLILTLRPTHVALFVGVQLSVAFLIQPILTASL